MKMDVPGVEPESVLETVNRFCICYFFSDIYKIDHLSKQQVIASDSSNSLGSEHFPCGTLSCNFYYNRAHGQKDRAQLAAEAAKKFDTHTSERRTCY